MRSRPPDATKPTKPGGEVGLGEADVTADCEAKYTDNGASHQWLRYTSADLILLVETFRSLFPSAPLPSHVQRAIGRQWSGA